MKDLGTSKNPLLKRQDILNYVDGRIGDRWGELVESLVEGKLIELLNGKNINVNSTYKREKGFYKEGEKIVEYENDLVARNGKEVVVVEVKTTLKTRDVDDFLTKLEKQMNKISAYQNKKIYGAVAFLKYNERADKYASKNGLFVIRATGDSAWIVNHQNFKPKDFSQIN